MTARHHLIYLVLLAITSPAMSADTMPIAECVDLIQEVAGKDDGKGVVFDRYGDLLAEQGKTDAALRAYEKALLDGGIDGVSTTEKLAHLQEKLGKTDEAIVSWQHLLALKPDHSAATDRLARLYMLRTSYKQALPLLQKLHEQQPDEACYAAMLGRVYLHERLLEPAEAAFLAAYKIDPTDRDIVVNLGGLYRYLGKHEQAATLYRDYLIRDDSDREMRRLLVSQLIRLKRVDTDMLAMLELEARDEPSAANFYRLGTGYKLKGVHELAVQTFERALAVEPTHDKSLNALGRHYFLKGEYTRAKDYFTRVSQEGSEGDDADEYLRRIKLLTSPVIKNALKANTSMDKRKKKPGELPNKIKKTTNGTKRSLQGLNSQQTTGGK